MELYPLSFSLEPGQRSVCTTIVGKKSVLQDVRVRLHEPPDGFTLSRYGDAWRISWEHEVTTDTGIMLEAQGAGGQMIRPTVLLRAPEGAAAPAEPEAPVAEAPAPPTPQQRYEMLVAGGLPPDQARSVSGLPESEDT
jgi:hypothetical protein